jgi:3-oxoacyl-(acyl-carrier-protein) synthase
MSLAIAGMGWVTPLGSGIDEVWGRLQRGEEGAAEPISDSVGKKTYPVFRVPTTALKDLPVHPRLRRASAISRFAVAAGLSALRESGVNVDATNAKRIALIFAISNGGVIYTKRFYHDIVASGADAASPLLFPETVFNAPASHLAAILGITGATYTLVGDGAVGLLAIKMAEDLMMDDALEYCLVIGAEEAEWLLCDAYAKWRLLRGKPPISPFQQPPRGMILSEGAGAILVARQGAVKIAKTDGGSNYPKRSKLAEAAAQVLKNLGDVPADTVIIGSAGGTFVDEAEAKAISSVLPRSAVYTPKPALGESVGASGLWQTIIGATALRARQLPPLLHAEPNAALQIRPASVHTPVGSCALVLSCGLNQQVSGLRLSL